MILLLVIILSKKILRVFFFFLNTRFLLSTKIKISKTFSQQFKANLNFIFNFSSFNIDLQPLQSFFNRENLSLFLLTLYLIIKKLQLNNAWERILKQSTFRQSDRRFYKLFSENKLGQSLEYMQLKSITSKQAPSTLPEIAQALQKKASFFNSSTTQTQFSIFFRSYLWSILTAQSFDTIKINSDSFNYVIFCKKLKIFCEKQIIARLFHNVNTFVVDTWIYFDKEFQLADDNIFNEMLYFTNTLTSKNLSKSRIKRFQKICKNKSTFQFFPNFFETASSYIFLQNHSDLQQFESNFVTSTRYSQIFFEILSMLTNKSTGILEIEFDSLMGFTTWVKFFPKILGVVDVIETPASQEASKIIFETNVAKMNFTTNLNLDVTRFLSSSFLNISISLSQKRYWASVFFSQTLLATYMLNYRLAHVSNINRLTGLDSSNHLFFKYPSLSNILPARQISSYRAIKIRVKKKKKSVTFSQNNLIFIYRVLPLLHHITGKKILLTVNVLDFQSLSFQNNILILIWAKRLMRYKKTISAKLYIEESLHVWWFALVSHDAAFATRWVKKIFMDIPFWKHRLFFFYLKKIFASYFKFAFEELNCRGVKILINGKISVAGNARTRTIRMRFGFTSATTVSYKVAYSFVPLSTFTGALGFHLWIFF